MKNYKPFDLEKALAGDPVMDEEGNIGKYIYTSNTNEHQLLFILKHRNSGEEYTCWYNEYGTNPYVTSVLLMAPKKKTIWVNIYKNHTPTYHSGSFTYDTEQEAMDNKNTAADFYYGAVAIEIEE